MIEQQTGSRIRVEALAVAGQEQAEHWAQRLGLPLHDAEADFALQSTDDGLQLQQLGDDAPGAVRVDFVEGAVAHRRLFGGGTGQMIAKAVGIQPGVRPSVLDATAGLGKDAFVLASLGCELSLIERQPIIAALLEDGLARGRDDRDVGSIVARMHLLTGNSIEIIRGWTAEPPQVIYLDPMFPHREKTLWSKRKCACSGLWSAMTWMRLHCWKRLLRLPPTVLWSNARARPPALTGQSQVMRWMENPAATTSTRRRP